MHTEVLCNSNVMRTGHGQSGSHGLNCQNTGQGMQSDLASVHACLCAGLLDATVFARRYAAFADREVLQPPRTFEYSDATIEPHYLTSTASLAVRTVPSSPVCWLRTHNPSG